MYSIPLFDNTKITETEIDLPLQMTKKEDFSHISKTLDFTKEFSSNKKQRRFKQENYPTLFFDEQVIEKAAIIIQNFWRTCLEKKNKSFFESHRTAKIVFIQRFWRLYASNKLKNNKETINKNSNRSYSKKKLELSNFFPLENILQSETGKQTDNSNFFNNDDSDFLNHYEANILDIYSHGCKISRNTSKLKNSFVFSPKSINKTKVHHSVEVEQTININDDNKSLNIIENACSFIQTKWRDYKLRSSYEKEWRIKNFDCVKKNGKSENEQEVTNITSKKSISLQKSNSHSNLWEKKSNETYFYFSETDLESYLRKSESFSNDHSFGKKKEEEIQQNYLSIKHDINSTTV